MITTTAGIVLSRRPLGEADRSVMIYTRDLGRVSLRFTGVLKPRGKLKALSEPLVCAEFRLHLRPWAGQGRCLGGQLQTVYPGLRRDLGRTLEALKWCELVERLTPERAPNPAKFDLLDSFLRRLELAPSPWLSPAFSLRFLELAGLLPPEPVDEDGSAVWEGLRGSDLQELAGFPGLPGRVREYVDRHVKSHLDRPLRTEAFSIA